MPKPQRGQIVTPPTLLVCVGGPCDGQQGDITGQRYLDMEDSEGGTWRYERAVFGQVTTMEREARTIEMLVPVGMTALDGLAMLLQAYIVKGRST